MKTVKRKNNASGLLNLRNQLGFSQEMMAMYLEVSHSTIKLAELGDRSLPTAALIKVANMEIQLAAGKAQDIYETMHPAEYRGEQFNKNYDHFFSPEAKCGYVSCRLSLQLKAYIENYHIIRNKLQVIEAAIIENKDNPPAAENWKRQQHIAIKGLHKYGLPIQGMLKSRIHFLDNQVALYKKLKEQIMKELPGLIK